MYILKRASALSCAVAFLLSSTSLLAGPFDDLERKFPLHFRGFGKAEEGVVTEFQHRRDTKEILSPCPRLRSKFGELQVALHERDVPSLQTLKTDIERILEDPRQQTLVNYTLCLAKACLLVSPQREEEKDFFRAVGFPRPYEVITALRGGEDPDVCLLAALIDSEVDTLDEFHRALSHTFSDPHDQVEKLLGQSNPFQSLPYFMLCTQPKEDIFGLFYLAMMYSKGIHPIPVTLKEQGGELHGIQMTPWGKFCHDFAHSKADPADHSVTQFANFLLNHYLKKLEENLPKLSAEDRRKYGIKAMIPHMTRFARDVHTAYRQSLVDILERSISHYNLTPDLTALPAEFTAFSAGAFYKAHEAPDDMSTAYVTSDLGALLRRAVPAEDATAPEEDEDLFKTSFLTGETTLTDEEIIKIALGQARSTYTYPRYVVGGDSKLPEEKVSECVVSRNKFSIRVTVTMMDGSENIFKAYTNYSRRLNLAHDRAFLRSAREVLSRDYGYVIPEIPQEAAFAGNIQGFEQAVKACRQQLDQGMKHLAHFYQEQATLISTHAEGDDAHRTIADDYAGMYSRALRKLRTHMPRTFADDMQKFVSEAMPVPVKSEPARDEAAAAAAEGGAAATPAVNHDEAAEGDSARAGGGGRDER